MSVTTYAQNFEDIILLRALRHIERGFYIDVGAQDPIKYSVTKTFYELGWRGINIEPVSYWFQLLEKDRVHDINLNVALSDSPGSLRLYEVQGTGLSTTEKVFARRHAEAGFEVREVEVPCVTLDSICEANGVDQVHFLKVDCEGAETAALRGFSFNVRPWIILVEATEPLSEKPTYAEWEPILLDHAYEFVYADGLNRFYLANEHNDLAGSFGIPPNVFDAFVPAVVVDATKQLEVLQSQLKIAAGVERSVHAEIERDKFREQFIESSSVANHLSSVVKRLETELARALADVDRLSVRLRQADADLDATVIQVAEGLQQLDVLAQELGSMRVERHALDRFIHEVLTSKSWRYTRPLRFLMRLARGSIGARDAARTLITRAAGKLARVRLLRVVVRVLLSPLPGFKDRLRGIAKRGLGIQREEAPATEQPVPDVVLSKAATEALSILHIEKDRRTAAIN